VFDVTLRGAWLRLLNGRLDVEFVSSQLTCQADVLPGTTNRNRLLVFVDNHIGSFGILVNFNSNELSRAKCATDKLVGVITVWNDINLFLISDFVHNCLYSRSVSTDVGTDGIDTRNAREDR